MSGNDEKQKAFYKRLERVTSKQFSSFLDAKGVTTKCPQCGIEGYQIIAESGHATLEDLLKGQEGKSFVTFFRHEPAHPGDSDANYYYKMSCANCGYITTYGVTPVLMWLDNLKSGDEGESDE
ncbi:hypothetical protein [Serratia plymuthica]|uniref:hypothetical protein n=1 Tax=Serratia plymuthica TaxID=82996 RepID=UPI00055FEF2B|nr:hypothetical protein [Serratia plymuthica]